MNKSAIRDILNGARGHRESISFDKINQATQSLVCDGYVEVKKQLSLKDLFVEGFKLGLRIGIECMDDDEK